MLPTRQFRWCCAEYKEYAGAGTVTLIGVRSAESLNRAKRKEIAVNGKKYFSFDEFDVDREQIISCVKGRDKILVSPIFKWITAEVWQFLRGNGIEYCKLYDEGYHRIGCILCPMANRKQKIMDCNRFPHVKRRWLQTIQKLIDAGYINHNFKDAQTGFDWWISDKSFKRYDADERLQGKIDF